MESSTYFSTQNNVIAVLNKLQARGKRTVHIRLEIEMYSKAMIMVKKMIPHILQSIVQIIVQSIVQIIMCRRVKNCVQSTLYSTIQFTVHILNIICYRFNFGVQNKENYRIQYIGQ